MSVAHRFVGFSAQTVADIAEQQAAVRLGLDVQKIWRAIGDYPMGRYELERLAELCLKANDRKKTEDAFEILISAVVSLVIVHRSQSDITFGES